MTEPEGLRPFEYYQAPPPGWQQQGPPKPGTIPLRPLSLGDLYGGSIDTIRRNRQIMLLVPFVFALLLQAVQIPLTLTLTRDLPSIAPSSRVPRPEELAAVFGRAFGTGTIVLIVGGLLSTLMLGVLTVVISRAVLGQRPTFGAAVKAAAPRYLPLLGLVIMIGLIEFAAIAVPVALGIGLGALIGSYPAIAGFALLGGLAGVVLAVYLAICFVFAPTALILEPQPVFRALSRSRWLTRGAWWRILGISILTGIIAAAVAFVLQVPVGIWEGISAFQNVRFPRGSTPVITPVVASLPQMIVGGLLTAIASALTTPFAYGVTVLLYHDQRIRMERFDIPLAQMASGGQPEAS
jgi:hypothetical protein